MIRIATLAAGALALGFSTPAVASDDQDVRQLKSKDAPDLASGKAYFFYDTLESKYDIYFLRSMTERELDRYTANRETALAEARDKLRSKRDGAPGVSDEQLLPDVGFDFIDDSIRNLARMDSGRVYEKDGNRRTYAVEVPPGEYTIFAAGIDGFIGGTCMCMGTVRFDAKAGEAVDLGAILVAPENGKTDIAELAPYEAPEYIRRKALPFKMSVRLPQAGDAVPALLGDMQVSPAVYSAATDHIPNTMGMLINRMAPIDGVLAYDEDRVIDVRGASSSASSEGMEPVGEEPRKGAEDAGDTVETNANGEG